MRVSLSPLRAHKMSHNFQDTPSDICQCGMDAESTAHYLLDCELFIEARINLFEIVNPILQAKGLHFPSNNHLVNFILYGDNSLSMKENKIVLNGTLKYIKDSRRFVLDNEE